MTMRTAINALLFAVLLTTSSGVAAQVSVQPNQIPNTVEMNQDAVRPSPEWLAARVRELNQRVKALEDRLAESDRRFEEFLSEWRDFKAAATPPACATDKRYSERPGTSRRSDCFPYICEEVSGLCRSMCTT